MTVSVTDDANSGPVIAIAGGGTGGHLYPALAVTEVLRQRVPGLRFVFFGSDRPIDRQILEGRASCELVPQHLPPLHRAPWRWPGILRGYLSSGSACAAKLAADRVALVIGTGGLASVPAVLRARRAKIPTVLLNPDAVPGKANRLLARWADLILVQWEDSLAHFLRHPHVEVAGCAIRAGFAPMTRAEGAARFDLDPQRKTLLATGASQGARTLNEALLANLELFEARGDWQILHLTGRRDYEQVRQAYQGRGVPARVLAFTEDMPAALGAADLVLSRAGASSLAEITAVGRASILMPYPFHRDQHQYANAHCLTRQGAALIVPDAVDVARNGPALREALERLLVSDEERGALAQAAAEMGRPDAADRIAQRTLELAGL